MDFEYEKTLVYVGCETSIYKICCPNEMEAIKLFNSIKKIKEKSNGQRLQEAIEG